jgi:DNA invertase Pin-like site-specific DNA recombinase
MATPIRAAIYARISEDRDGTRAGVDRQLADCRRLVEQRGWVVFDEYVDNDRSAWSGRERPQYAAMLADLGDRRFDALVTYHQDRLSRNPREFEEFLAACERVGMRRFTTVCGVTDLGNSDGIMVARVFSAIAANASDATSRRVRRASDERAAKGLPHGQGERPFGYELDGLTVREDEAQVIREAVSRLLAGESISSLVGWLGAAGVRTSTGMNVWRSPTLRNLLMSPRIAGLRQHRGEVVGPAVWPAIITVEQRERVVALLTNPARRTLRTARRYSLSGLVRCALCGGKMVSAPNRDRRRYGCRSGPDFGGCGKVYVTAPSLEAFIADAVLMRLDSPAMAEALAGRHGEDSDFQRLSAQVREDTEQLEELARAWGDKKISMGEWLTAKQVVADRLKESERALARLSRDDALIGLVGTGERLRAQWDELNLSQQSAIIRAVVDHVVIDKAKGPSPRLDPGRIRAIWKV